MNEKESIDQNIEEESKEPTLEELVAACQEVIPAEDSKELLTMDFEEALGYAFTLLIENGVEDPESFLKEKGILEESE